MNPPDCLPSMVPCVGTISLCKIDPSCIKVKACMLFKMPGRRTAGAGPAHGGWPLPACGEPIRIKQHQNAAFTSITVIILLSVLSQLDHSLSLCYHSLVCAIILLSVLSHESTPDPLRPAAEPLLTWVQSGAHSLTHRTVRRVVNPATTPTRNGAAQNRKLS